jgi:hypothetical protein
MVRQVFFAVAGSPEFIVFAFRAVQADIDGYIHGFQEIGHLVIQQIAVGVQPVINFKFFG